MWIQKNQIISYCLSTQVFETHSLVQLFQVIRYLIGLSKEGKTLEFRSGYSPAANNKSHLCLSLLVSFLRSNSNLQSIFAIIVSYVHMSSPFNTHGIPFSDSFQNWWKVTRKIDISSSIY